MSSDVVIRVESVSKCFRIYDRPIDWLRQAIVPRLTRLVGGRIGRPYFREFWALRDVSFEVRRGQTVGIVGRNGSGKSTLLQIICGTLEPTDGHVSVQGRVAALLELGAGFNLECTGRENVYMNATILGLTKREIDSRFHSIETFADIGSFLEEPVKTYSSGMYVRLAFAIMAHVDADVLVIDEALAVGDVFFSQKCMRFLREFMKTGTVLFVSHDTASIRSLCNRALWLDSGVLKQTGSAKEISEAYLEAFYAAIQGGSDSGRPRVAQMKTEPEVEFRDMRQDLYIASNLRNDIEIFRFVPGNLSFGTGNAQIVFVTVEDERERPLSWVVGGESVSLKVRCEAKALLVRPIVGFFIKDNLGQTLFGDNTFQTHQETPVYVSPGEFVEARFYFRMPTLPSGDYSICAAIAEGTQADHVQHHWIHDAVILRSHSTSVCTGLVGVPMRNIELRAINE